MWCAQSVVNHLYVVLYVYSIISYPRSKELADCKSPTSQIRKLKAMLEELGVKGRPTIEKCEAIKAERELKAELDSLDTTLILNEEKTEGRPRTRAKKNKPSYVIPADTESEEEEGEESEDESEEDSEEDSEDEFEEMSEDD
ncbi:hypothetical protein BDB01DRAFT_277005 [Pilobolus umbonatus]|nr:hypothetical protein BDB01DRAFT_277005 [Pilobolus umbonatus]